jgi:hypothetical protein
MKKLFCIAVSIIFLMSIMKISYAQEQLLPLRYNTALFNHVKTSFCKKHSAFTF